MSYLVHIDRQKYAVADHDIASLKARILDAVRHGGEFVAIVTTPKIDVLVTSATPIKIVEVVPAPLETEDLPDLGVFYADLDLGVLVR